MSSASLGRTTRITAVIVGVVVLLAVLALSVLWFIQRDRVLPNTTVAHIDAGGMTTEELRAALAPVAEDRETAPVVFTFEGEEHTLEPTAVGFGVDVDQTIATAMSRGRESFFDDIGVRIGSYRTDATVELQQRLDEQILTDWVNDLADRLDRDEVRGEVTITHDPVGVELEPSQGAVTVDRDATLEQARAALLTPGPDELALPATTTEQPIADADLTALQQQVERAVAEPLILRSGDASLTLEPTALARMISIEETSGGSTGTTLTMVVDEDAVETVIGEVARGRFDISPVSADFTADREPPQTFDAQADGTYTPVEVSVEIEPGHTGARVDTATTAGQLQGLLRDGTREAEIDLEVAEPAITNDAAEQLRPTHAIGTFTTYYTAGQTRNANIQLLADVIDGTLVLPDEQFSINEISGARTCDKGYEPAGTIVRGELVDTCGGGTSQFGTTVFNAAFFSGVQLDQWRAHSWYISRYPMGREATLSYPELDVRFTNTTEGAILVKTSHTDSSVTVTLLGQPVARSVSASHAAPTDPTSYPTTERTDSSLSPGAQRTVQHGIDGFTIVVTRTITHLDGETSTQDIRTVYRPQARIIERGPAASAPPPPEPDDDDGGGEDVVGADDDGADDDPGADSGNGEAQDTGDGHDDDA